MAHFGMSWVHYTFLLKIRGTIGGGEGRMVLASLSHIFAYTVPWGFGFGIQNFAMG